MSYSVNDEVLKKYILENFLEKLENLTPLQDFKKNRYFQLSKKKNFKVLNETKIIHQKRKNLSKVQILEFSILFIILNHLEVAAKKTDELSNLVFLSEKNESLKNIIISSLPYNNNEEEIKLKIKNNYDKLINEINENSNIQLIIKNKNEQEVTEIFEELIMDYKEQNNLKKIETLEKKLINNLDENSFSELIKLKSQLNRE